MPTNLFTLRRCAGLDLRRPPRWPSPPSGQRPTTLRARPTPSRPTRATSRSPAWRPGSPATRPPMPPATAARARARAASRTCSTPRTSRDNTTMTINGHALAGSDDYLASVKLDERPTSDRSTPATSASAPSTTGSAGSFPEPTSSRRGAPRSSTSTAARSGSTSSSPGPNAPVFTLSFHDDIRTGMKDSSEWAPVDQPAGGRRQGRAGRQRRSRRTRPTSPPMS